MRRAAVILAMALGLSACEGSKPVVPQPASLEDGDRCYADRDWNCAAANYNGYLKSYPNDPAANAKLGIARTRAGHHREAVPFYRHAEALGVATYDMWAGYAISLEATGDLDGAIRANEKALEAVPTLVDVRGSLAAQLVRRGEPEAALVLLEDFDAYLRENGQRPYFAAQIASIREQMQRNQQTARTTASANTRPS